MKLYYSPGACSQACHIILQELGVPFETEKVDMMTKKTAHGENFTEINKKGYVPCLKLDNGEMLTEGVAIMQYLADQKPEMKLVPKFGNIERYRMMEWMNYLSTELHKDGYTLLFSAKNLVPDKDAQATFKQVVIEKMNKKFDFINRHLEGKSFILGDQFTIADAYLFTIVGWSKHVDIQLNKWPNIHSYVERVATRPSVQKTIKAEN